MAVEQIAAQHSERQVQLGRRTARELARLWRLIDSRNIGASWRGMLPQAIVALATSQATAAASAGVYVGDVLEGYGLDDAAAGRIMPGAFAGIASDGRDLAGLLYEPAIMSLRQIGRGASAARGLATGRFVLDMIARTQVADAGRVADGVAIAVRPQLRGYVRMVVGKTCPRCLILAGRVYRWNKGFLRHPRCDCRHIPVTEDVPDDVRTDPKAYFDALDAAGQDELLGKAGAEAVRSGADMAKVVNARRGMVTADGRLFTTEAAGRRPRIMPEQIFRDAHDRDDAIRLLRLHGYVI